MRAAGAHLVPLTLSTLSLLEELRSLNGDSMRVFAGRNPRKHISTKTIIYALYRMGYEGRMMGCGFRSVASTILNEAMTAGVAGEELHRFKEDWIEVQLAHAEKSPWSLPPNGAPRREGSNKYPYLLHFGQPKLRMNASKFAARKVIS
jgi:hypothetical protein